MAILLDELEDLVVIFGGGVTDATALNNFEGLKIKLYGLHSFAIDSGRKDKGVGLEVVFAGKETVVHGSTFL